MQVKPPAGTHMQNLLITSVKISNIGNKYRGKKKLVPYDWLHNRSHASCIHTISVHAMHHMTNVRCVREHRKSSTSMGTAWTFTKIHLQLSFFKLTFHISFFFFKEAIDFTLLDSEGFVQGLKVVKHTCVVFISPSFVLPARFAPTCSPRFYLNLFLFSVLSLWNL